MATRPKRERNPEGRMSLGAHLVELRKRLVIAAIAILVGAIGGWFIYDFVFAALQAPITQIVESTGAKASIAFFGITDAFDLRLQIAITAGIVVSSPIWLYQIWAFFVPGLHRREKRYALSFIGTAIPLFFLGCLAGYYVLPHIVVLMLGFAGDGSSIPIGAKGYYDFMIKLMLATGIAFVLPVFLVLLNFVGVLSAKAIIKGWRVAILLICLFTAIATPAADVISMFLLAIPMVILYFGAAGIAFLHDRRQARRADNLEASIA
jgi:sec-independent protein translocase protein TatC